MLKYRLLNRARVDLEQIIYHIASGSPAAAHKMKNAIMKACELLGENPYVGQIRTDLTTKPVRFWAVHRNYMIIYSAETPVKILRIYNTAQDVSSLL